MAQALPLQLGPFLPKLLVAILLLPTNFSAQDPNPFTWGKGTNMLTNIAIKALKTASKGRVPRGGITGGGEVVTVIFG